MLSSVNKISLLFIMKEKKKKNPYAVFYQFYFYYEENRTDICQETYGV